jgi:hypothetical protein
VVRKSSSSSASRSPYSSNRHSPCSSDTKRLKSSTWSRLTATTRSRTDCNFTYLTMGAKVAWLWVALLGVLMVAGMGKPLMIEEKDEFLSLVRSKNIAVVFYG